MATQSVLIVDDEPDIRELLDITLSRMGLQTHSAANLGEAMTMVAELKPDLCLTDMRLPDGNGISLVEHIQQEFSHIPVAMITAHGSVETAISALKAGAFDFVSKPIELDNLRRREQDRIERPLDENLLAAMQHGLPDCSGVALGLDRLLMLATGNTDIREILAFDWERS